MKTKLVFCTRLKSNYLRGNIDQQKIKTAFFQEYYEPIKVHKGIMTLFMRTMLQGKILGFLFSSQKYSSNFTGLRQLTSYTFEV